MLYIMHIISAGMGRQIDRMYNSLLIVYILFLQEWADKLIECTIAYYSHDIIHWEDLPRSNYNRHEVWKQQECICQMVEPHLSELQLGQFIWFNNLAKREHKTFSSGHIEYGRTVVI